MFRNWKALALAVLSLCALSLPADGQTTQCQYRTTPPTLQNGQRITPLCNANGTLKTDSSVGVDTADWAAPTVTTLVAATPTQLLAASSSRKRVWLVNRTGASLYLRFDGANASGAAADYEMVTGKEMVFTLTFTAKLSAYSVAGGAVWMTTAQ